MAVAGRRVEATRLAEVRARVPGIVPRRQHARPDGSAVGAARNAERGVHRDRPVGEERDPDHRGSVAARERCRHRVTPLRRRWRKNDDSNPTTRRRPPGGARVANAAPRSSPTRNDCAARTRASAPRAPPSFAHLAHRRVRHGERRVVRAVRQRIGRLELPAADHASDLRRRTQPCCASTCRRRGWSTRWLRCSSRRPNRCGPGGWRAPRHRRWFARACSTESGGGPFLVRSKATRRSPRRARRPRAADRGPRR